MHTSLWGFLIWIGIAGALTACSSSSDSGPDCRFNQAWENGECTLEIPADVITLPDGIWRGVDANNRPVVALVNRFSAFQYVDGERSQGAGMLAVGSNNTVSGNFQLVTESGSNFVDGSTLADCRFTGELVQRQSLTLVESCTTSAGLSFQRDLSLSFDPVYLRVASLHTIAGNFATPTGSTLSITAAGELFAQDAATSCVTNGEVRLTVSFTNMYFVDYDIDGCAGAAAIWNGSRFSGLAFLDNTTSPESLHYAVTGELDGVPISVVAKNDRI